MSVFTSRPADTFRNAETSAMVWRPGVDTFFAGSVAFGVPGFGFRATACSTLAA